MFRIIRKGTLLVAIAAAAWGSVPVLAVPATNSDKPAPNKDKPEQIIILQEEGKPDRKCLILSTTKQGDGSTAYKVKALDNGQVMTIYDRPQKTLPQASESSTKVTTAKPTSQTTESTPPPPIPEKLTSTAAQASRVTPPPAPKPSWWQRLFSSSSSTTSKSEPKCETCVRGNPVPLIIPKSTNTNETMPNVVVPSNSAKNVTKATSVTRTETPPPPLATDDLVIKPVTVEEKAPFVVPGPVLPEASPKTLPMTVMTPPAPLPQYHFAPEPNPEDEKIQQCKVALKGALFPSEREQAAETLIHTSRGNAPEIRALLLVSAQEDPAATVRLTCLRCLAKQGIKDSALMTTLIAAQKDRDVRVRDEAELALSMLNRKK